MPTACKWCGSKDHTQFYCREKPRKQIPKVSKKRLANPVSQKVAKPINKIGKKAKQWEITAREWKKANPPDDMGYWYCKVGGAKLGDGKSGDFGGYYRLNLCHDKSRARHPELAFDLKNIFAGCGRHNREQGSRTLKEYLENDHSPFCGDF